MNNTVVRAPSAACSRIVCHCLRVTEAEVVNAIELYALAEVKDVVRCTGAGSGCMACRHRLRGLLEAEASAQSG